MGAAENTKGTAMRRSLALAAVAVTTVLALALPASATVHEITGMFCSQTGGNPFPPGISGGSKADNFAKPLFATGFVASVEPHNGGILISFDFDHPASKLVPTGEIVEVEPGVFITGFALDPDHGFTNCKNLR